MHQNLAIISRQFNHSKKSFIVLVLGLNNLACEVCLNEEDCKEIGWKQMQTKDKDKMKEKINPN